nr:transposase, MuDR, MULE transposase domain protein [Tanacetum cinerariifolium]
MRCSVPHTYDQIKAMVEKQIQDDRVRQLAMMNLAHQFNDASLAKDEFQKAYEECRDIPLKQPNMTYEITDWAAHKVAKRSMKSATWVVKGVNNYQYEVSDGRYIRAVNLQTGICECRKWQLSGIPCGHVIAVTRFMGLTDCVQYVADWFIKPKYQGTYPESIHFLGNMSQWDFPQNINKAIPPRMDNPHPGRPKNTNCIPSQGEEPRLLHCSRCTQSRHRRDQCDKSFVVQPPVNILVGKLQIFVSHNPIDLSTVLIPDDGSLEESFAGVISEETKMKLEESLSYLHPLQKRKNKKFYYYELLSELDIFTFIHTPDPTKVRVFEREQNEDEPRLLDTTVGRTVPLLSVAPDRADSELEASVERLFDEGGSGGVSHPPKKLREDHGTPSGAFVGGKSRSTLRMLLVGVVLNAKVGVTAVPTLPFVTASVSTTLEREDGDHTDSVAEPNLHTIRAPQRSSFPIMTTATTVTFTDDSALVAKEKLVKPFLFSADSFSAGRADPNTGVFSDLTSSDFLIGGIRTVIDPDTDLQKVYVPQWSVTNGSLICKDYA